MLEERPRRTCCGRSRTQRLRGTTVLVQDGTGMEICNANCACATRWIVGPYVYSKRNFSSSLGYVLLLLYLPVIHKSASLRSSGEIVYGKFDVVDPRSLPRFAALPRVGGRGGGGSPQVGGRGGGGSPR